MKLGIKVLLKVLIFNCLLLGCLNKDDFPSNVVSIKFLVTDDQDHPVSGAHVYIFSNPIDLQNTISNYKPANVLDSTTSVNGNCNVDVDPRKQYWLLIYYKDPVRQIRLSNGNYSNEIKNLIQNTDISVKVQLSPIEGNLAFWSSDSTSLPITITVGSDSFLLSQQRSIAPQNAADVAQVLVGRADGVQKYYAKNAQGCIWEGEVALKKGLYVPVQLNTCTSSKILFWTSDINKIRMPIIIKINDADNYTLNKTYSIPYVCGTDETNAVVLTRGSGVYTYFASSADGKCVWSGNFQIQKSGCMPIELKACTR